MSLDPILALLQVSTALGILYIALPEGRYRTKLLQRIATAFKTQEYNDKLTEDSITRELLQQREFSDTYQKVTMWREELPDPYDAELLESSAVLFPRHSGRNPEAEQNALPESYRWFKANKDKNRCLTVAVILPVAAMLGLAVLVWADQSWWLAPQLVCCGIALLGAGCVGASVKKGRDMVEDQTEAFRTALSDTVSAVEREQAKDLLA